MTSSARIPAETWSPDETVWRRYDAIEARLTAPLSDRMLDLAGLEPGMRVLDLASGRGEPAMRAARRVGPTGFVLGIDSSPGVLRIAREQADAEHLSHLELRVANAEIADDIPRNHFHAATIRWGLMYLTNPVAALINVRGALLGSGVFVAAIWVQPERATFFTTPRRILSRYRSLPVPDPAAPGMFAYADMKRVTRDFADAGLAVDHVEDLVVPIFDAATASEVVAWTRALGSGLGKLVSDLPPDTQIAWEQDCAAEWERHRVNDCIRLHGVTRLVRAHVI